MWEPIILVVMVIPLIPVHWRVGWFPEQVLPLLVFDEQIYRFYDVHSASPFSCECRGPRNGLSALFQLSNVSSPLCGVVE